MPELLTLAGVKGAFVTGLSWRHEDREPKHRALRARADAMDARWAVVHKTRTGQIQAGFCAPIEGVKSRQVKPLAAIVADSHPQPWFGIYRLADDQYWYIAVRDGQEVLPDGDQTGTLEQMEAAHEAHLRYGHWHEVRGNERDLAEIVRKGSRVSSLTDLYADRRRALVVIATVFTVGVALTAAYKWHQQHQLEKERAAALARQLAQQALLNAQAAKQRVPPWIRQPPPSAIVEACGAAWHPQELALKGWVLSGWSCKLDAQVPPSSISIEAKWKRVGGVAADAPGVLIDSENSKTLHVQPGHFESLGPRDEDVANASRAAWTFAQRNALQMTLTDASPIGSLPGANGANPTPVEPWKTSTVDILLPIAPWLGFADAINAVSGLRLTEVQLDGSGQWHLLGRLYETRAFAAGAIENKGA